MPMVKTNEKMRELGQRLQLIAVEIKNAVDFKATVVEDMHEGLDEMKLAIDELESLIDRAEPAR